MIAAVVFLALAPHVIAAPDLSGVWEPEGLQSIHSSASALLLHPDAKGKTADPDANCTLSGVPRLDLGPKPFKILQSPDEVVILYQAYTTYRQVFTDGRPLPIDPQPSWLGYSVGKWDGDTFAVDTLGVNARTWLDNAGRPHSDAMHLTERYHRRDFGHLDMKLTIDDPKAYTKPWSVDENAVLLPDTDLLEYACSENNKDVDHLVGK